MNLSDFRDGGANEGLETSSCVVDDRRYGAVGLRQFGHIRGRRPAWIASSGAHPQIQKYAIENAARELCSR